MPAKPSTSTARASSAAVRLRSLPGRKVRTALISSLSSSRHIEPAGGDADCLGVWRFIEAIGFPLVRAQEREQPLDPLLVIDFPNPVGTVLGHFYGFGEIPLDQKARHRMLLSFFANLLDPGWVKHQNISVAVIGFCPGGPTCRFILRSPPPLRAAC